MKAQALLSTGAAIGVTLVCLLGVSWIGPSGAFLNLLTAIPAAWVGMRYGWQSAVIVVVVSSLLVVQLASIYSLLAYLALFGVGSVLLPLTLLRGLAWDRAILVATAGATALTALMVAAALLSGQGNLLQLVDSVVQVEVEQALQVYNNAGLSSDQLAEMKAVTSSLADFVRANFAGLYLAILLALQALSLVILQRLKGSHYKINGVLFRQWRLPQMLIWLLIVAGFSLLVPLSAIQWFGRTLLALLLPLYFFQGMAVVSSYLQQKTYPPMIKGLIYVLLLMINPLPLIVTSVGVFDLWIDFRRPRQKNIQ